MAIWVLVLPREAVVGELCAGRKIIAVTQKSEFKYLDWVCKKTYRMLPAGEYRVVKVE